MRDSDPGERAGGRTRSLCALIAALASTMSAPPGCASPAASSTQANAPGPEPGGERGGVPGVAAWVNVNDPEWIRMRDELRARLKPLAARLKASPRSADASHARDVLQVAYRHLQHGNVAGAEKALAEHDAAMARAVRNHPPQTAEPKPRAAAVGECACAPPNSYCCLDARGNGACVAGLDACESMVFACSKEADCPDGPAGMILEACDGEPVSQCVYRFTRSAAAHAEEVRDAEKASAADAKADLGRRELAQGKQIEATAVDAAGQAEALKHFVAACAADSAEGCELAAERYVNAWGTKQDVARGVRLAAKACKLGARGACMNDFGCVQSTEIAIAGRPAGRDRMRVRRGFGVETAGACDGLCEKGLPGACHTAGNYHAAAGRDAIAKKRFSRACALGDRRGCED